MNVSGGQPTKGAVNIDAIVGVCADSTLRCCKYREGMVSGGQPTKCDLNIGDIVGVSRG